ncbi:MAG: ABC transporter substrate-binding protein [Caldilineaceae bacterium]|nr:ABC transporter substrate-binding protein [Caldilineaceae bacterium]
MRRLLFLFIILMLSACAPLSPVASPMLPTEEAEPALRPITLGVGYIPSVQFAPFYVGMTQGFYAEEGLELSLDYGFENDYLKLVGTGDFQFMIGSGDQVVLGRAQGLPVRYVMNWYGRYPVTIFAKSETGITKPTDLAGKRIGVPGPFGATYIALRAILETAGLTEADIQMQSIGFTQAASVSQNIVDAATDYAVNGPVVLTLAGIEITQIPLDEYLQIPANGLITNEATLSAEPALVAAMVRATLRSVEYTLANPDEAFAIALTYVPEAGGENEVANRAIFDASLIYWAPRPEGAHGATTVAEWENVAALLQRIGLVDHLVDVESLYTNQFVE